MRIATILIALSLAALPVLSAAQSSGGLDPALLLKPLSDTWPTYSGDYSGRRYSALTQINRTTVKNLTLSWVARLKKDVLDRVAARVKNARPGEWIRGVGWDEGKLAERRYITAADLDSVSPGNPVWLTHTTNHYGVGNSAALKLAGITRDTRDPPAGTIDRDAKGNPTGVLKESAQQLVTSRIPPLSAGQQNQGIVQLMKEFNREGMTGAKDPGIGDQKWNLYQEILKEGQLTVRIFALWSGGRSLNATKQLIERVSMRPHPPSSPSDELIIFGGVKMFMDGSGGARTAWMYDDWNKNSTEKDTGNAGYPVMPPDEYRESVKLLHNAGFHISTHAIGDRAIDWVVDSYDQALKAKPTRGLRHGIIHAKTTRRISARSGQRIGVLKDLAPVRVARNMKVSSALSVRYDAAK